MKLTKRRILSIVIAAVTLIATGAYYTMVYHYTAKPESLTEALTEYTGMPVEIAGIEEAGNRLFVLFKDPGGGPMMGYALFDRGMNTLYRPVSAGYGNSIGVEVYPFTASGKRKVAVCGANADPRAVAYEVITVDEEPPQVVFSGEIAERDFVDIYEHPKTEGLWRGLRLLDADGNDLAPELYASGMADGPGTGIGTAELFMTDIFCILILLVGFVVAKYFWDEKQLPEDKKE